jgi:hypothetical protein
MMALGGIVGFVERCISYIIAKSNVVEWKHCALKDTYSVEINLSILQMVL